MLATGGYQSPGRMGPKLGVTRLRDLTRGLFLVPLVMGKPRESQLPASSSLILVIFVGGTFKPNRLPFASVRAEEVNRPRSSQ